MFVTGDANQSLPGISPRDCFVRRRLCCVLFLFPGSAGSQAVDVKAKGDALLRNKLLLE